ncbi:alpha/beta hydrolase [Streptomyces sp. P1-3]|uniref:alpha/beta hydrolase n=1 Tax=Streptomyces sp. P1-3 TaxID=3421658 RepID=UPI003D3692F5
MRAVALYGVLGSLAMTALTVTPATGAASSPPGGAAEAYGVTVAAQRAADRGIAFHRCPRVERLPSPVECGTVAVPLDYADPDGQKISLTVSRARATGPKKRHQGALVYNPGGPGGSGMRFPAYAAEAPYRKLAKAYDFVGYAPRGVGRSGPLSCQNPAEFAKAPTSSPSRPSAEFKRRMIVKAQRYAQGCLRKAGATLPHYTTLNNARDLDVLRAALGEKRLNFLGASYGTYFGAVYATLFPGHVRRMVFDSIVDPAPHQIWYSANLHQSLAFERRWADWRRWVAAHHAIYHLGRTPGQVQASYDKIRRELDRAPAGGKVGTGQLHAAFLRVGYHDGYWDPSAHALAAFLHGNAKPLVKLAMPDPAQAKADENGNAVYTAVECNDAPWPDQWWVWDHDNTALARRAPFETWDNAWMNLPCAYWPVPRQQPVDVGAERGELAPVLLLAAERDAATPYSGALELHRRLPGSVLVTERDAGTHGIAGGPNGCVNAHVDRYLLTGRTPRSDASCAGRGEPKPTDGKPRATRAMVPRVP